jgi:subtilisin family serine protease
MTELLIILFAFFVQFTDKNGSEHIALSEQAIEKRMERSIAIDSMDYAVSPLYIDSLQSIGCHIYHTSRWMNGATIETDSNTIRKIAAWTFVDSIYLTRGNTFNIPFASFRKRQVENEYEETTWLSDGQIEQLNLHMLHNAGFFGQGKTIGVIDGGFQNVTSLSAFDAVREQILGMYDTTDDKDSITGPTGSHGTKCFSTIAAITPEYQGAATSANYYLIRSEEYYTESPKEMDNWVTAIELADSLGVDIVSSSLGYAMFDDSRLTLSYTDMDGQSTRCTQAANIAARKGMLVIVAAGNEGDNTWHYISAPSDAEDIITVGAVDQYDSITKFSSWGPTADGRTKPEVCARGYQTAVINTMNSSVVYGNGTSFACPIIAGLAACLWSALPNANNMEIREIIIQSADRYSQPHDQYGYGIPDAWKAYGQPTDLFQNMTSETYKAKKILINGNIWFIYNGKQYNVIGQKKG